MVCGIYYHKGLLQFLQQKEALDQEMQKKVARAFKISPEAINNFSEEAGDILSTRGKCQQSKNERYNCRDWSHKITLIGAATPCGKRMNRADYRLQKFVDVFTVSEFF